MPIKLTIGTAVYNIDEPLLRNHIENVMNQLNDETEFLLIDDCSTNNSGEVCREYADRDSRIRYIKLEQNGGLSVVRNRTISEAKGKWILFADGDDLISDYFVQTALNFYDTDYDIIIYERLKFNGVKPADTPCQKQLSELPEGAGITISQSCLCLNPHSGKELGLPSRAFFHAAWGGLYRKDFLTDNNLLFPVGQKKAQDSVFNTMAYYYAKKIAYLPYVMYYYLNNDQGITKRYSPDLRKVFESLLGHLDRCKQQLYPDDPEVENSYRDHRIMSVVIDYMRLNVFHRNNPKSKSERKSDFFDFINSEPYKNAIQNFDVETSGRWEWFLIVKLLRKKRFNTLDKFVGNPRLFGKLSGAYKRFKKK